MPELISTVISFSVLVCLFWCLRADPRLCFCQAHWVTGPVSKGAAKREMIDWGPLLLRAQYTSYLSLSVAFICVFLHHFPRAHAGSLWGSFTVSVFFPASPFYDFLLCLSVPGLTECHKNDCTTVALSLLHIYWLTSLSSSETGKGIIATRAKNTVSWYVTGLFDWQSSPSPQTLQKWRKPMHTHCFHYLCCSSPAVASGWWAFIKYLM